MLEIINNLNNDIKEILEIDNNYLSKEEVKGLIINKNKILKDNGLIEINNNVLKILIEYFSNSSFIDRSNYNEILNELVSVFYSYRINLSNRISDEEIIKYLYYNFENTCNGEIILLYDKFDLFKEG